MASELLVTPFLVLIIFGFLLMVMRHNVKRETHVVFGAYFILKSLMGLVILFAIPRQIIWLEYLRGYLYILAHTLFYIGWFSLYFPVKRLLKRYLPLFSFTFVTVTFYVLALASMSTVELQAAFAYFAEGNVLEQLADSLMGDAPFLRLSIALCAVIAAALWLVGAFQAEVIKIMIRYVKFSRDNYSYSDRVGVRHIILWEVFILVAFFMDVSASLAHHMHYWLQLSYALFQLFYATALFYLITSQWESNAKGPNLFLAYIKSNDAEKYAYFLCEKEQPLISETPQEQQAATGLEPIANDKREELRDKLVSYFVQEKPYLSKKLNMNDVAKGMGTNRTYISQVINTEFNITFFEFVNVFRIEELKKITSESSLYSMKNIVESCGFSSYTTFSKYHSMYKNKSAEWYNNYVRNSSL